MRTTAAPTCADSKLVDGAGHWVQQEQPEKTSELILRFVKG